MNLIENLGGYESAKSKFRDNGSLHAGRLKKALLDYRRQHNIFEVGDKVVVKAEPFWPEDYIIQTVGQEHIGKWYMAAWKHATDAEIKAGKRLEVNQ